MKKIEILTPPIVSKQNNGYAIYVDGKKVWESPTSFDSNSGEKIKVNDLLTALGFKLHIVEITDKVLNNNYGIFPDELEDLSKYSKEEKFEHDRVDKLIPGDEYNFDSIYFPEEENIEDNDDFAYDVDYDLPDFENPDNVEWLDVDDYISDDDDYNY